MPKGPNGQKRPADAIGLAVMVAKIATGEVEETQVERTAAAEAGKRGGNARAAALSPGQRSAISRRAAQKRWGQPE
jgi:hypothetical protein